MRRPADLLLVVGYAAGLGLIAWILLLPAQPDDQIAPATQIALPDLETPPTVIESRQVYDAIIERPLFRADRSPVTQETSVNVVAPTPVARTDGFRLSAVFRDNEKLTALVELPSGDTLTVRKGDRLENWQVAEIQDQKVVLSHSGQRKTLLVHDFAYLGKPPPVSRTRALTERARRSADRQATKNRTVTSRQRLRRENEPEERD